MTALCACTQESDKRQKVVAVCDAQAPRERFRIFPDILPWRLVPYLYRLAEGAITGKEREDRSGYRQPGIS